MELKTYQQKLAGLIRGTYAVSADDNEHLKAIAESVNLEVTQEVILRWRQLSIENYCRLTARALKLLGIFHDETHQFVAAHGFSPYVEELGQDFLAALERHEIKWLASLARFERALIDVQHGTRDKVTVRWRHDPYAVLGRVIEGSALSTLQPGGQYETYIAKDLPGLFNVTKVECQP